MTRSLQVNKNSALLAPTSSKEGVALLRSKVSVLKRELCEIQGIIDSDDLKLCVDALTGRPVLILREDAQKKFEALFYYVQALHAVSEIELLLDEVDSTLSE